MFFPIACSFTCWPLVSPARPLQVWAGAGPACPAAQERRGKQGWLRNERCFQLSGVQGYNLFCLYFEAQFKWDAFCPTACILSDLFHCYGVHGCCLLYYTLMHLTSSFQNAFLTFRGFYLLITSLFFPVNISLISRRWNWLLRTNFQPSHRIHWLDFCLQISV